MKRAVAFLILVLLPALLLSPAGAQGPEAAEGPYRGTPVREVEENPTSGSMAPVAHIWQIERVDAPKTFSGMGQRSLALDSSGHPHIAYGQDHLYYAYGDRWQ